ncbi:MAG TPA: glycosyltransferase [Candidatus Eisenbacteria bacterium]|nr:glycosyltransferase [Candidatus Eisenbacteria bacterium]
MNILMMTNTYKPILGGLEKSVESFTLEYRRRGHRVIIVAPEFDGAPQEEDVVRVPSIQNVNRTEFAVPISGLTETMKDFRPDIVHAHHPFLLGATALRVAYKNAAPLVFTHHILFEQNTHYLPGGDTEAFKRFVIELSTGYANLADQVFAPSESLAGILRERGVESPLETVPTGINLALFESGDRARGRAKWKLPEDAFVVGHVGRLAPEKNLEFLAEAVARFLEKQPRARFLLVGKGPSEETVRAVFEARGLTDRLHSAGALSGAALADAYRAMDVFAFASQSETQGIVLVEAMASGAPVVAVDACGVRDVVRDGENGRLLAGQSLESFAQALEWIAGLSPAETAKLGEGARATARGYAMQRSADKALMLYASCSLRADIRQVEDTAWARSMRRMKAEWDLMKNFTRATKDAMIGKEEAASAAP